MASYRFFKRNTHLGMIDSRRLSEKTCQNRKNPDFNFLKQKSPSEKESSSDAVANAVKQSRRSGGSRFAGSRESGDECLKDENWEGSKQALPTQRRKVREDYAKLLQSRESGKKNNHCFLYSFATPLRSLRLCGSLLNAYPPKFIFPQRGIHRPQPKSRR